NRFLTQHLLTKAPLPSYPPPFNDAFVVFPLEGPAPLTLRDNEYLGIRHNQLNRLITPSVAAKMHKLVVWQPVVFGNRTGLEVHRHLRAVDKNALLSRLTAADMATEYDWLVPPGRLKAAFERYP